MPNELFVADLEVRLRTPEAVELLHRYREARKAGHSAPIAMLDRDVMRRLGSHLVVLEQAPDGEFIVLYCGRIVPDDAGQTLAGKTTATIHSDGASLYRLGCMEAGTIGDAVAVNHRSGPCSAVHKWECLFLPMEDDSKAQIYAVLCMPREHKHEFLADLLDALPVAAIAAIPQRDARGEIVDATIISANRPALDFLGNAATPDQDTMADLLNTSLGTLFGTGAGGAWDRELAVLRSGRAQVFDHHHRGEAGGRWFKIHVTPIRDGLLVAFFDITEMKRAFLELEHQRKMLMEEIEQRRRLEQELWALAHLDPLTGLPNRRAFRESATLKLAENQSRQLPVALITIDIDHFKRINDVFGHGVGDTVLRRVADIIRSPLRPNTDVSARMGGEEFTLMLPDTEAEAAMAFAEKLRRRVEQTVVIVGEQEVRMTISLGLAMNRTNGDLDDLIDRADRALYAAKRSGRNKVCSEAETNARARSAAA